MKTYDLTQRRPDAVDQSLLIQNNRAGTGIPDAGKAYTLWKETVTSVLATIVLAD